MNFVHKVVKNSNYILFFIKFVKTINTMEHSAQQSQMKAIWFARTLDKNKQRIKAGIKPMQKQDYDDEWDIIVNSFK